MESLHFPDLCAGLSENRVSPIPKDDAVFIFPSTIAIEDDTTILRHTLSCGTKMCVCC